MRTLSAGAAKVLPLVFFAALAKPTGAAAVSLRLTWQDNSNDESGFKIERLVNGTLTEIATVGADVVSYTDSGLVAGALYCYQVRAFNSAGSSSASNLACVTTPTQNGGATSPSSNGNGGSGKSGGPGSAGDSGSGGANLASDDSQWRDYRVSVKITSQDDDYVGVIFRYVDRRNFYRFSWTRQDRLRVLEKIENGVPSVLAHDNEPYTTGRTYGVVITASGPHLEVAVDGRPIFSATDASFPAGTVALYSAYNAGTIFDDVLVTDLSSGATLLSADFADRRFTGWTMIDETTSGERSAWSALNARLEQTSNIGAWSSTAGVLGSYALYTSRNWTDYRFRAKVRSDSDGALGVLFRFVNHYRHYLLSWSAREPGRRLIKNAGGVLTVLAEDKVPYVPGRTYQLEVIAQGTTLRVRIDGADVFSVTDSSLSRGTVGLYSRANPGSVFDDVVVEDLSTGATLLADSFSDADSVGWTFIDDYAATGGPSRWSAASGSLIQSSPIGSGGIAGTYAIY